MLFGKLFGKDSDNFEKRCKLRTKIGIANMMLGLLTIAVAFMGQPEGSGIREMYTSLGVGLAAGGLVHAIRNRKILRNPELKKTREIMENDERNREIGLRCWAYTGYSMFLLLYLGMLAGGFIDKMIMQVLLAVLAVYALLLCGFKLLLQRRM